MVAHFGAFFADRSEPSLGNIGGLEQVARLLMGGEGRGEAAAVGGGGHGWGGLGEKGSCQRSEREGEGGGIVK